ncbi:MAG: PKD domain-containing protein, partial [Bacteroidia bacterium]
TDFEPSKHYAEAKSYTIALTVTSEKGCLNTKSLPVVTYEAPKASFVTLNFSPCVNESRLDLDNTSGINSSDVLSYEWQIAGNTLTQTDIINYQFETYGPKLVTLKVTSDKGCEDIYQTSFMVLPSPNVSFVIDEPFQCEDNNLFTALNTSDNQLSPIVGMEWELEDGRILNGLTTEFSFPEHGSYSVQLTLLNLAGCEASAITTVLVHPQPVAAFAADEVCQSQAVTFDNQSTVPSGSIQTAMWDFGDQQKANTLATSHKYDAPGEYAVYLEVSTDKGCTDFVVNKVRVNEEPKAEFTFKKYGYKSEVDETIYEFLSQETDPQAKIDWYVNGIKRASGKKAYLGFNDTGHHHVTMTVSTGAGCPGTAYKEIFVAPPFELYMPTAFTPDGNGKNDILLPTASSYIQEYSMLIINRWGSVMFQSIDPTQGWDGTFRGESVEPGVYIYIIKLKDIEGVEWNYQGSVLVLH